MKYFLLIFFIGSIYGLNAQITKSYIVISDTSYNFHDLEQKLSKYSSMYNFEIDMQNKIYDPKKNRICLPQNDDDELYAGMYYPRRFASEYLSIEYIQYYKNERNNDLMGIIFLITEDKSEAKKKVAEIRKDIPSVHIIKANIYVGCMH